MNSYLTKMKPGSELPSQLGGLYSFHETIGTGGFAKVKLATHIPTKEKVAIKIMDKRKLKDDLPRIRTEISALKELRHRHVCQLFQVIETETHIFMVMEFLRGGELFDYIVERDKLSEDEARMFFRQIVSAVAYIHNRGYAHRDLKPENLLLDADLKLRLIDFGLCAKPQGGMASVLETCCGSPAYAAPELIAGKRYLGSEADIWSMGVILYAVLCGHLPFDDEHLGVMYRLIQSGTYDIPDYLSNGSITLLRQMLQVNPKDRITIEQLARHPWITHGYVQCIETRGSDEVEVYPDFGAIEKMEEFYGRSMEDILEILNNWLYDDMTAMYLLLKQQRKRGVPVRIYSPPLSGKLQDEESVPIPLSFEEDRFRSQSLSEDVLSVCSSNLLVDDNKGPGKSSGVSKSPWLGKALRDSLKVRSKAANDDKENFVVPFATPAKKAKAKPSTPACNFGSKLSPSRSVDTQLNGVGTSSFDMNVPVTPSKKSLSVDAEINRSGLEDWNPLGMSQPLSSSKKMLNSIERGLDRMKLMLTPRKKAASKVHEGPRYAKALLNVSTTSATSADYVINELKLAILKKGILVKQNGYTIRGKSRDEETGRVTFSFELEVCKIPGMDVIGIRRKRLNGDAWQYKRICEEVLAMAALPPPE